MPICPVCSQETHFFIEKHNEYEIYQCKNCELQFSCPMEEKKEIYEKGYLGISNEHPFKMYNMWLRDLKKIHSSIINEFIVSTSAYHYVLKIVPYIVSKDKTVFDYGCGQGIILKRLKQKGFKVYGCDIVKPLVDSLTALGYEVYTGTLNDYPSSWETPDVIILSEIIEHLSNPLEFFRSIIQKFPKATLVITVPHPRRPHLSIGIREYWDYPPNHFTRWTSKSLEWALKKVGYRKIKIVEYPVYWREALVPLTLKTLKLLHRKRENKIQEDMQKITASKRKILLYPLLYFLGKLLGIYYTFKGLRGQSLIAIAFQRHHASNNIRSVT